MSDIAVQGKSDFGKDGHCNTDLIIYIFLPSSSDDICIYLVMYWYITCVMAEEKRLGILYL